MMPRQPLAPLSLSAWLRWDVVRRLLPSDAQSILEIGAGGGSMGALLARRLQYIGLEPDPASHQIALQRIGRAGLVLDRTAEAFDPEQPFDVVCAFEVLEHFEDDRSTLASWLRHVRPGGWLLVSVPHGRRKFGAWDVKAGHFRRYDRSDLHDVLASTGLEAITIVAYGFPLGSAASFVRTTLAARESHDSTMEQRTAGSARNYQPADWAGGLTRAVSAPFRLLQRPFASTQLGPGLVARARLPGA